jgi:hypothetical protein
MQVSDHCLIALYNQQMLRALDVQWTMLHSGLWNTLCRVETGRDGPGKRFDPRVERVFFIV